MNPSGQQWCSVRNPCLHDNQYRIIHLPYLSGACLATQKSKDFQGETPSKGTTQIFNISYLSVFATRYSSEAYWVPLTIGDWILYPLMLGGWNQLIIYPLLPKAAFQDIFLICYDAQKANYVKRNSLRCYSIVPSRSPNENLHGNPRHWTC